MVVEPFVSLSRQVLTAATNQKARVASIEEFDARDFEKP